MCKIKKDKFFKFSNLDNMEDFFCKTKRFKNYAANTIRLAKEGGFPSEILIRNDQLFLILN
jgi:hypothetical protein